MQKKDEEFEFMMFMEKSDKRKMEEQHAARMHELRKSLDYIKQTEWMYEPIDKLLGEKKQIHNIFETCMYFFKIL